MLAVASTTGEWWVMDSTTGEVLSSYKSGPEQIDAISYSPGKSGPEKWTLSATVQVSPVRNI